MLNHHGGGKSLLLLAHLTKLQRVTKTVSKNNKIFKQKLRYFCYIFSLLQEEKAVLEIKASPLTQREILHFSFFSISSLGTVLPQFPPLNMAVLKNTSCICLFSYIKCPKSNTHNWSMSLQQSWNIRLYQANNILQIWTSTSFLLLVWGPRPWTWHF